MAHAPLRSTLTQQPGDFMTTDLSLSCLCPKPSVASRDLPNRFHHPPPAPVKLHWPHTLFLLTHCDPDTLTSSLQHSCLHSPRGLCTHCFPSPDCSSLKSYSSEAQLPPQSFYQLRSPSLHPQDTLFSCAAHDIDCDHILKRLLDQRTSPGRNDGSSHFRMFWA